MKPYDPALHRELAHQVLRTLLSRGRVPYTPHPGDWDWWTFYADPRDRTDLLIGPRALAAISLGAHGAATDDGEVAAAGLAADEVIELGRTMLPGIRFTVSHVSVADHTQVDALRAAGFELDGPPSRLFERATSGASPSPVEGFEIRPLRGEQEHASRADAARLAFASTLTPEAHRARYLAFMRSPAYVPEHDMVAVTPDGTIAALAIYWPDAELSLAQFEPVGTHPDFQHRGLARALLNESLARLAATGIERARVMTGGPNQRAISTYLATGFEPVDEVGAYRAPASFERLPKRDPDPRRLYGAFGETLLDRQIREAAEQGQFDNLPHQGQPLPKDEHPYDTEWGLAFHVLRNAGYAPPWIEADKEVRALLARRDAMLARASTGPAPSESGQRRDRLALEKLVTEVNAAITRLNAEAPTARQHRRSLALADELHRYDEACRR